MNLRNIHALSNEEIDLFNKKYKASIQGKYLILVSNTGKREITLAHKLTDKFPIFAGDKKLFIQPLAIDYWKKYFVNKFTLFEVQNAINSLLVFKQKVDENSINNYLKGNEE